MKQERGFAWGKLIGAIAILALLFAIIKAITGYIDNVDQRAYKRGKDEATADYAKRDNEALKKALARVKQLEDEARAAEQKHAAALARIDRQRNKEINDAKAQHERDLAAVRSGNLQLRDPGATACRPALSGGGSEGKAGAAAGQRDAETGGHLSAAASGFLLGLVNEADDIARQLAAAQQVIEEQIRTCNGP